MKDYIKPTFILAGLAPVAFAAGCAVKVTDNADLEIYFERFGITDPKQAFTESDKCEKPLPDGLTQYCKFTSIGEGAGIVFTS